MTYLWTSLNARSADRRSSWIWSLSWANFSFSISCKDYKTKTNIQYWFLFIKVKLFWNLEPKFSKRFAEIWNLNMLMAVMTPPDPLKWPKTPQSRPGWLKSTYLVTLIYPLCLFWFRILSKFLENSVWNFKVTSLEQLSVAEFSG